jgi:CelD/BcsL family acetyltransferase involved in cellulose biosynthesis/RimJ/RimL family protein N-acetyltransferase
VRVVVLKEIPEDEALRCQWNQLVERMERPQIFFTYEWALAVQRAYGESLRPLLFLMYEEADSLCGVAALAVDSCRQEISFLGATTGDYCDFLSSPANRMPFVAAVFDELGRQKDIRKIILTNLPADSPTVTAIRQSARQKHYRYFARTAYQCAQIFLESLRRKSGEKPRLPRKKMLRRFLNAMGREGPVRLDHGRSWNDIAPVLDQFMLAHVARFLAAQRISNMARPERRRFILELAKLLSEPGWIVLTRMISREKAVAWNYGFQFQGTWFWYQPTFDNDLEKYSPGFCLLAKIIEEAVEDPSLSVVDLGLGAEEYKERFANQNRETLHLTLQKSTRAHLRDMLRYRVATLVKAAPKVEVAMRWLQCQTREVKERFQQDGATKTLSSLTKRTGERVWARTEVLLYECSSALLREDDFQLRLLDLSQLASAVIEYVNDEATLNYLLRSAKRLCAEGCEGFALLDRAGRLRHFAWIIDFEKFFLGELNVRVKAPFPDGLVLFDYWTPPALRGCGYCARAIELIADRQKTQGKRTWIYSSAENASAIRAIEKAGFHRSSSLFRQRILWWQRVHGTAPASATSSAEVSVRA